MATAPLGLVPPLSRRTILLLLTVAKASGLRRYPRPADATSATTLTIRNASGFERRVKELVGEENEANRPRTVVAHLTESGVVGGNR